MPKPPPPAPSQATTLGHRPVWDPPYASAASRWTCPQPCGATVIRVGRNVYGTATEKPCTCSDEALLIAIMRTGAAVIEDTSQQTVARQAATHSAGIERWGAHAMERLSAWSVSERADAADLVRTAEEEPEVLRRVLVPPRVDDHALNLAAAITQQDRTGVVLAIGWTCTSA